MSGGLDTVLVVVHVPAGLAAVMTGATAMLAVKGGRTHRRAGLAYLAALAVVGLSGTGLVVTRWPLFPHLFGLAVAAGMLAGAGYAARRRPSHVPHLLAMGMSYVAMLTAFYVDNGPRLPLWRLLPASAFWILPSLVALPLLFRAVHRHGRSDRSRVGAAP